MSDQRPTYKDTIRYIEALDDMGHSPTCLLIELSIERPSQTFDAELEGVEDRKWKIELS